MMGWWQIKDVETGGIGATNVGPSVVGEDKEGGQYNGDEAADVMGDAIAAIDTLFVAEWGRCPTPDELHACFNFVFNAWKTRREESIERHKKA